MSTPGQKKPMSPLAVAAVAAFAAGLLAWAWLGDWRWAVTGVVLLLVLSVAGAALEGRKQ